MGCAQTLGVGFRKRRLDVALHLRHARLLEGETRRHRRAAKHRTDEGSLALRRCEPLQRCRHDVCGHSRQGQIQLSPLRHRPGHDARRISHPVCPVVHVVVAAAAVVRPQPAALRRRPCADHQQGTHRHRPGRTGSAGRFCRTRRRSLLFRETAEQRRRGDCGDQCGRKNTKFPLRPLPLPTDEGFPCLQRARLPAAHGCRCSERWVRHKRAQPCHPGLSAL